MSEPFPPTSRHARVETATWTAPDGRAIVHLRRRAVPSPEQFATLTEHVVTQGERIDRLAAQHLGDPEQFWRLCDANGVLHPEELTSVVGRRVRVTLPEGVPGGTDDE